MDGRRRRSWNRIPRRLPIENGDNPVRHGRAAVCLTAREHLVQHAAKRPDVRALVDRQPARLLRTHVRGGAEQAALERAVQLGRREREAWRDLVAQFGLGEPEVEHLHATVGRQLDVLRFEITMNDATLVCGIERIGDLPRDRQRLGDRECTRDASIGGTTQALSERGSFDELQHQGWRAGVLLDAVDLSDVRMIERGEDTRFPIEARAALGIGDPLRRQNLDRDVAAEPAVATAVHRPHAAHAQEPLDHVRSDRPADERLIHVLACGFYVIV